MSEMIGIMGALRTDTQFASVVASLPPAERQKMKEVVDTLPCMEERIESIRRSAAETSLAGPRHERYDFYHHEAALEAREMRHAWLEEQIYNRFEPLLIRGQEHQRIARYNQGDGAHQSRRNRGGKPLYKERRHAYSLPKYSLVGG